MMKLSRIANWVALSAAMLLSACGGGQGFQKLILPEDRLDAREEAALVEYVRQVILNSKKLPLSDGERLLVARTRPQSRLYYTGHKEGGFDIKWQVGYNRLVGIRGKGDLTDPEDCGCAVSVIGMDKTSDLRKNPLPPDKIDRSQAPPDAPAAKP
jgi:hypothetical protein